MSNIIQNDNKSKSKKKSIITITVIGFCLLLAIIVFTLQKPIYIKKHTPTCNYAISHNLSSDTDIAQEVILFSKYAMDLYNQIDNDFSSDYYSDAREKVENSLTSDLLSKLSNILSNNTLNINDDDIAYLDRSFFEVLNQCNEDFIAGNYKQYLPRLVYCCTGMENEYLYSTYAKSTADDIIFKLLNTVYKETINDSLTEYINTLYSFSHYNDYLGLVEFLKQTNRYDYFESSITNLTSYFNQLKDSKKGPTSVPYSRTVGVNGTVTYSCQYVCDDFCANCKSCKSNINISDHCTFSYRFSTKDRGWIGCPQCQDIPGWWDWYTED